MLDLLLKIVLLLALAAGSAGAGPITPPAPVAAQADASDMDVYGAAIQSALARLGAGVQGVVSLMGTPAIASKEWQANVASSLADIRAGHAALVATNPPAGMTDAHTAMTAATQHCADGADAVQVAIDEGNTLGLYAAAQLFQVCADGITAAAGMMGGAQR